MFWFRIDNRLIHGQVIEAWLPYTGASSLVVANDSLVEDETRKLIMLLAVPRRIQVIFAPVEEVGALVKRQQAKKAKTLVLFADCADARRALESGLEVTTLNIGNLHYGQGKEQICAHVALSGEDKKCLGYFSARGVTLDFRCVPNETPEVADWL